MNQVDMIINCRWLIPVQPEGQIYENTAIIIDKGKIIDILPEANEQTRYCSKQTVALPNHAVLPGFVNAHTHSPMTLFRGLADDLPLMEWLNNHIWPAEAKWLNNEFIKDGTDLAIAEMIRSGTTCFNEHFFFPEAIARQATDSKIRATIGATIINFPTNWSKDEVDGFNQFKSLYEQSANNDLLNFALAPHAPYTTTDFILREIADYSKEHHLPIHIHLHETETEVNDSLKQYGKRPVKRLYDLGLLSKRLQCVHMTQIDQEDLDLLKETGANVTHCPESNLKLASGYCKVEWLLQNNINVALGTDGAASNNDLDMIGEMRTAALIGKPVANSATAVSAINVLKMATINGAKALGLEDKIGSIEIGKYADIIAIDLAQINTMPIYNPISQIVYSATNRQVTDVFVAGVPLLRNGELQTLDPDQLFYNANKWRQRISNK
jgi:5-methylthioadenosine/S-adenosylhomocysteine deaminase